MTLEQWARKIAAELARLTGEHGVPNGFGSGDSAGDCNTTCPPALAGRIARRPDLCALIGRESGCVVAPNFDTTGRFIRWWVASFHRPTCARCPHPPHLGICTRRSGQTAYKCGCSCSTPRG